MRISKKTILSVIGVISLLVLVGSFTYAFFELQGADAVIKNVTVQAHTLDTLTFSINDNLSLETNQDNFKNGDANVSGEATATAILSPNRKQEVQQNIIIYHFI